MAAVGVGNAPAYRGRGTVFIEDRAAPANESSLTFEVYTGSDEEGAARKRSEFPIHAG